LVAVVVWSPVSMASGTEQWSGCKWLNRTC
jgi:hypothetical protein